MARESRQRRQGEDNGVRTSRCYGAATGQSRWRHGLGIRDTGCSMQTGEHANVYMGPALEKRPEWEAGFCAEEALLFASQSNEARKICLALPDRHISIAWRVGQLSVCHQMSRNKLRTRDSGGRSKI